MSDEPVLYSSEGAIATVTINRPDRRNAINPAVVEGISRALSEADENSDIGVVVLTGEGDRAFCAGGDLGGMAVDAGKVAEHFSRAAVGDLFEQMRALRLPVVARVNGHALAGGFGLMLACDLVVAAADAEFGMPEIDIGLWPFMISAVVQRDLPRKVALELMMTGRRMDAEEASQWGIVNSVVHRDDLDGAVQELASSLASKSPLIASLGKSSYYRVEDMAFRDALDYLSGMLTLCLESEDTVEGVTAFIEKRSPSWKAR